MAKVEPQIVVVLSDLHCGSSLAICPPDFSCLDGNTIQHNAFQKFLWEAWQQANDYIQRATKGHPFILLLNGDLVEGVHHGTKQVISADTADHVEAAIQVLKPLAEQAHQVHVVLGTECHTHSTEAGIGKALKASVDPATRKHAHARLLFRVKGCLVSATHHVGTTSRPWLESGDYGRAMTAERAEAQRAGHPVPDLMVRGHRHRAGFYTDYTSGLVITGAWQGLTRFGYKAVPGAICEPSVAVLDWRGRDEGDLPLVDQRVFTPPPPRVL